MSFTANKTRHADAVIDCQAAMSDKENPQVLRTEQNHKGSVDINDIVAKAAGDLDRIAASTNIQALTFDENPYNNFEEMMVMITKGKSAFESLPAETRKEFDNNSAKYMDYVRNPENKEAMIERGWLNPDPVPPDPVEVIVTNHETSPIVETPPE